MFAFSRQEKVVVFISLSLLVVGSLILLGQNIYVAWLSHQGSVGGGVVETENPSLEEDPGPSGEGQDLAPAGNKERQEVHLITVHVAGEVKEPGVYTLAPDARVVDAIKAAGGATEDAALDFLNLASRLQDGLKVYVPSKQEVAAGGWTGTAWAPGAEPNNQGERERVDLNSADSATLQTLPGIGPALAERIIEYRRTHGGFRSPEELMRISGIGPRKFSDLKDRITVR